MKAFPHHEESMSEYQFGMDLRDYFAAKALQGLLACSDVEGTERGLSKIAYGYADAMLEARK